MNDWFFGRNDLPLSNDEPQDVFSTEPQDVFSTPRNEWRLVSLSRAVRLCEESMRRSICRALSSDLPLTAMKGRVFMEDLPEPLLEDLHREIPLALKDLGRRSLQTASTNNLNITLNKRYMATCPKRQWDMVRIAIPHEVAHILHFKILDEAIREYNEARTLKNNSCLPEATPRNGEWYQGYFGYMKVCVEWGASSPCLRIGAVSGGDSGRFSAHGKIWKELYRNCIGATFLTKNRFAREGHEYEDLEDPLVKGLA